jgi:hypothetical protein
MSTFFLEVFKQKNNRPEVKNTAWSLQFTPIERFLRSRNVMIRIAMIKSYKYLIIVVSLFSWQQSQQPIGRG